MNCPKRLLRFLTAINSNSMVGTVSEPDALLRKVQIMKDMGVNAIRTAHNCESTG